MYQVSCKNCSEEDPSTESIYVGTSGYSLHRRQMQHIEEIRRQQQSNAMAKHQRHAHPNLQPNFRSKPIRGGMQYNLDRYILEAHLIQENSQKDDVVLMNQRSEFGNRGIPRIEARTNLLWVLKHPEHDARTNATLHTKHTYAVHVTWDEALPIHACGTTI